MQIEISNEVQILNRTCSVLLIPTRTNIGCLFRNSIHRLTETLLNTQENHTQRMTRYCSHDERLQRNRCSNLYVSHCADDCHNIVYCTTCANDSEDNPGHDEG